MLWKIRKKSKEIPPPKKKVFLRKKKLKDLLLLGYYYQIKFFNFTTAVRSSFSSTTNWWDSQVWVTSGPSWAEVDSTMEVGPWWPTRDQSPLRVCSPEGPLCWWIFNRIRRPQWLVVSYLANIFYPIVRKHILIGEWISLKWFPSHIDVSLLKLVPHGLLLCRPASVMEIGLGRPLKWVFFFFYFIYLFCEWEKLMIFRA